MATDWRMNVWQPDGTARATVTSANGVASLPRLDTDGAGSSLEAEFVADPGAVTIEPRDIIQVEITTDGIAWEPVYKGYITIAGNERAPELRTFRATGMKQRFYEILIEDAEVASADVGTMVRAVLAAATLPTGATYAQSDVPLQTFTGGAYYPALQSIGGFLDAMAATVGPFIVPTGETYTFDGTVYTAGELVPRTQWGVDATGAVFFTRPARTAVAASETASGTGVVWADVEAEQVYDRVRLLYGTTWAQSGFGPAFVHDNLNPEIADTTYDAEDIPAYPLARSFGSGDYNAARVVTLDGPLDFMTHSLTGWTITYAAEYANFPNMYDGNDTTFATATELTGSKMVWNAPVGTKEVFFRIRVAFAGTTTNPIHHVRALWYDATETILQAVTHYVREWSVDTIYDVVFPFPIPAIIDPAAVNRVRIRFDLPYQTRVHEIQLFVPDVDLDTGGDTASDRFASVYTREPEPAASSVTLYNTRGAITQTLTLTPNGAAAIDLPVERITYALTIDEGLTTTYHAGQAYDPELLQERAVLTRLARNAAEDF